MTMGFSGKTLLAIFAAAGLLFVAPAAFGSDGDYNGDGVVDDADAQMLRDALNTAPGDPGFFAKGDENASGKALCR